MKRTLLIILLSIVVVGVISTASAAPSNQGTVPTKVALYSTVGETLYHYDLDATSGDLTLRDSVVLPVKIHYVAADPSANFIYVGSSNLGVGENGKHYLSAFKIDPVTGALQENGPDVALPERPINITVDKKAEHVVIAYNRSATLDSYEIMANGSVGRAVIQPERPDAAIYPHQVRMLPSGDAVVAVGRGNDATTTKPEDIGHLTIFHYNNGVLSQSQKLNMVPGIGPRHLDFHPTQPWIYISVERGNKLMMYTLKDNSFSAEPIFKKELLADVNLKNQRAGAIHVHPNGKFVYVSNRNDATVKAKSGQAVLAGGENNIAVFAIDQTTGEPTIIQHLDTRGIEARTFTIDPSGRFLIVANQEQRLGQDGKLISSGLVVFRIGTDGKLEFARKYDIDSQGKDLLWIGSVALPGSK